jgi:hypothetical protein
LYGEPAAVACASLSGGWALEQLAHRGREDGRGANGSLTSEDAVAASAWRSTWTEDPNRHVLRCPRGRGPCSGVAAQPKQEHGGGADGAESPASPSPTREVRRAGVADPGERGSRQRSSHGLIVSWAHLSRHRGSYLRRLRESCGSLRA